MNLSLSELIFAVFVPIMNSNEVLCLTGFPHFFPSRFLLPTWVFSLEGLFFYAFRHGGEESRSMRERELLEDFMNQIKIKQVKLS